MSERSPKRIKMTESTDNGELSLAPSFPEFLLHPETYLPQPEFVENFYIEVRANLSLFTEMTNMARTILL
jgi:hypothetical protein